MLDQSLDLFVIKPDFELSVMRPDQTLPGLTSRVLEGVASVIEKVHPDFVLVQGDTTTAYAAALAAFYSQVRLGHVEAGLRTYNLASPFPEEAMRQMTSRIARLHFAATERNRTALRNEGISDDQIYVTGNTVIDALFMVRDLISEGKRRDLLEIPDNLQIALSESPRRLVLITGHRRESFGEGIQDICKAIRALAIRYPDTIFAYPVHLNPNVMKPVYALLRGIPNVFLFEPMNYYTFVYLMNRSYMIISDSGGVQEEAPSLQVPVLVTRPVTERMEAVDSGSVKLVGCNAERIITEAELLLSDPAAHAAMVKTTNPFGDGKAADRILAILANDV